MSKQRKHRLLLLNYAKRRAMKQGVRFDLKESDFTIPEYCPVLAIPLYRNRGGHRQAANSPSLDRIKPDKGYVVGNVIVVSSRANSIKGDATRDELMRVACFYGGI